MRAVVTRVASASVTVGGEVVADLQGPGLLVLLGVTHADTTETATRTADKIAGLRILRDEASALDTGSPVLVVSQFTLYGDTHKGRRPSWVAAARGEQAAPLVDEVVSRLRAAGLPVQTGLFGATMQVHSVNDGPFTVLLEF